MPAKEHEIATRDATRHGDAGSSSALPREPRFVDRRLKVVGILLPILGAIALEGFRLHLERTGTWSAGTLEAWHVATLALMILGIVGFAMFMFRLIDRTERQIVRRNRDLTTSNAVAAAIQGQATVEAIVDGALEPLLETAGAVQAEVRLFDATDPSPEAVETRTRAKDGSVATDAHPNLDVPLTHGATTVGRLLLWYPPGTDADDSIGTHALSSLTTQIACAVQLARAVGDLNRRKVEGHALYDILLRVSNQDPTIPVLEAVARHAVTLLGADAAMITVAADAAQSIRFEGTPESPTLRPDGSAAVAWGLPAALAGDATDDPRWAHTTRHGVTGATGPLGEMWAARADGPEFSERDEGFLSTLASLVGIALTGAQMREGARQGAILSERTRIAREMHDSIAQVLGAVHLRLRALEGNVDVLPPQRIRAEVDALADVCAESYSDVREAILGLRDSQQHADRGLEDNLRAYLGKYSAHCGIATTLTNGTGHEVRLSPRAEVQIIRIVQEALTNVRKHAGATSATVSISGTDSSTGFTIEDDGVGFDDQAVRGGEGYGLVTMRDRAALLGGTVEISSVIGRGTTVRLTVPERPYPTRLARSPA